MEKKKKKINTLGFLGILGFLVLLWPLTGQWMFIFSIGYFGYVYFFWVIPDELFKESVRLSATTAFFLMTILSTLTWICWGIFSKLLDLVADMTILYWGLWMSVTAAIVVFGIKLYVIISNENKDLKKTGN
ncbi:DUF3796 domain-containing protein [Bacteroidota bacterium]